MKKSNKILLGGFLTVILLVTGIHVTLYAKYKNGHYTIYQQGGSNKQSSMPSFPNVSVITIRNITADISFGSVLSVEKDREGFMQYVQQGDSLVITGPDADDQMRDLSPVKLVLPYTANLSAYNSTMDFARGKENASINPNIFLYHSHANFSFSTKLSHLGHVKVNASDHSSAVFHGYIQVSQLDIQLENSFLEENRGDIGQLTITTDSASQLRLQAKHLLKAKITSIPSNP